MKHTRKILGICATIGLIVLIAFAVTRTSNGKFDGATKESREAILSSGGSSKNWSILHEIKLEEHLICAIGCEDDREIAIFEPLKDGKYGYVTSTKNTESEIVSIPVRLNDKRYLLSYADIPNPDRAEIIFTVNGAVKDPIILDATSGNVLVTELPSDDFDFEIRYYDKNGNEYK